MIYNIAICDNQEGRRKKLVEMLHVVASEYKRKFEVKEYIEEKAFLGELDIQRYHMVLFNILQAGTPITLQYAKMVQQKNPDICFISLCPREKYDYLVETIKEFSYLKDDISYRDFKEVMGKAMKWIELRYNRDQFEKRYVKLQVKRKIEYVEINRIIYMERKKDYITIHTLDREYYIENNGQVLLSQLNREPFVEIGKKYIINYSYLNSMDKKDNTNWWGKETTDYFAVMEGYGRVPLSRKEYSKLFQKYIKEILLKENYAATNDMKKIHMK